MKFLSSLLLVVFILAPSISNAGYIVAPSVSLYDRKTTDMGTDSEAKLTTVDFKFGYLLESGLYFGAMYSMTDEQLAVDTNDFLFGPTVGYYWEGLVALLTYHVIGDRDLGTGGIRYTKGSGFQLDLAYVVPVNSVFSLGPQLSYKDISYDDLETQGVLSSADHKWTAVTPSFALWFHF